MHILSVVNKFKNFRSLRSLGRATRAPVLKALCTYNTEIILKTTFGIILIIIGILFFTFGGLSAAGYAMNFSVRLNDPEYSKLYLFAKLVVPPLYFLISYKSFFAGLNKVSSKQEHEDT